VRKVTGMPEGEEVILPRHVREFIVNHDTLEYQFLLLMAF
jgi:hypothetical protein